MTTVDYRRPVEAVIPGVQGKVLGALAGTTRELHLRAVANVAQVSTGQASAVLATLVELGLVERRDVPPVALFRLAREDLAGRLIADLANLRQALVAELRAAAAEIEPAPASAVLFGSLARGDAGLDSDVDVLVVRPSDLDPDDDAWGRALHAFAGRVERSSGHPLGLAEVDEAELPSLLRSDRPAWAEIRRDGILLVGSPLTSWLRVGDDETEPNQGGAAA